MKTELKNAKDAAKAVIPGNFHMPSSKNKKMSDYQPKRLTYHLREWAKEQTKHKVIRRKNNKDQRGNNRD